MNERMRYKGARFKRDTFETTAALLFLMCLIQLRDDKILKQQGFVNLSLYVSLINGVKVTTFMRKCLFFVLNLPWLFSD